jgi:hypothetical protein
VGGGASVATAWVTQNSSSKTELLKRDLHRRQALYGEFVAECSKLLLDSLDHTLDRPDSMLNAVAMLNRIRLIASDPVLKAAEVVLQAIGQNYFAKNITMDDIKAQMLAGTRPAPDPLEPFSRACRSELRALQRF